MLNLGMMTILIRSVWHTGILFGTAQVVTMLRCRDFASFTKQRNREELEIVTYFYDGKEEEKEIQSVCAEFLKGKISERRRNACRYNDSLSLGSSEDCISLRSGPFRLFGNRASVQ